MREKLKNNTKIKLISLLSAVVLWMYVMAVIDPEETKLFEDLPVTITNMSEIREEGLVIYPEKEITTDISIKGKLSNLKKVKKENIHISGEINNPKEGKNSIYLKASISPNINHELKNSSEIIELEKIIDEKRTIEVKIDGKSKDIVIDGVRPSIDSVKVSGPRSLVQEVQKVVGTLDIGDNVDDFSTKLKLIPVNEKGKEVKGVNLEESYIDVYIKLLSQKSVPIKIRFKNGIEDEESLKDYKLSRDTITIRGKKEVIENIETINTQLIDITNISESTSREISLDIPEGVLSDSKTVTIKLDTVKTLTTEFSYSPEEVNINNNINNIDVTKLEIPEVIKVLVEYDETISLTKEDITLYLDLSGNTQNGKYSIKYEAKKELNSISINPKDIEIKE